MNGGQISKPYLNQGGGADYAHYINTPPPQIYVDVNRDFLMVHPSKQIFAQSVISGNAQCYLNFGAIFCFVMVAR